MMLKSTGVKIYLPHDLNQILFFESAMRGGVSYISLRHAVAETNEAENISYVLEYIDGKWLIEKILVAKRVKMTRMTHLIITLLLVVRFAQNKVLQNPLFILYLNMVITFT